MGGIDTDPNSSSAHASDYQCTTNGSRAVHWSRGADTESSSEGANPVVEADARREGRERRGHPFKAGSVGEVAGDTRGPSDALPSHHQSTPEGGEGLRKHTEADSGAGQAMGRVHRVHSQQAHRTSGFVQIKAPAIGGEEQGNDCEDEGAQCRDPEGGSEARSDRDTGGHIHKEPNIGAIDVDLTGLTDSEEETKDNGKHGTGGIVSSSPAKVQKIA